MALEGEERLITNGPENIAISWKVVSIFTATLFTYLKLLSSPSSHSTVINEFSLSASTCFLLHLQFGSHLVLSLRFGLQFYLDPYFIIYVHVSFSCYHRLISIGIPISFFSFLSSLQSLFQKSSVMLFQEFRRSFEFYFWWEWKKSTICFLYSPHKIRPY